MPQFAYAILSAFTFCQLFTLRFIMSRVDRSTHASMGCLMAFLVGVGITFAVMAIRAG